MRTSTKQQKSLKLRQSLSSLLDCYSLMTSKTRKRPDEQRRSITLHPLWTKPHNHQYVSDTRISTSPQMQLWNHSRARKSSYIVFYSPTERHRTRIHREFAINLFFTNHYNTKTIAIQDCQKHQESTTSSSYPQQPQTNPYKRNTKQPAILITTHNALASPSHWFRHAKAIQAPTLPHILLLSTFPHFPASIPQITTPSLLLSYNLLPLSIFQPSYSFPSSSSSLPRITPALPFLYICTTSTHSHPYSIQQASETLHFLKQL